MVFTAKQRPAMVVTVAVVTEVVTVVIVVIVIVIVVIPTIVVQHVAATTLGRRFYVILLWNSAMTRSKTSGLSSPLSRALVTSPKDPGTSGLPPSDHANQSAVPTS